MRSSDAIALIACVCGEKGVRLSLVPPLFHTKLADTKDILYLSDVQPGREGCQVGPKDPSCPMHSGGDTAMEG